MDGEGGASFPHRHPGFRRDDLSREIRVSEPQHQLRHDVVLNLIRPAVNRRCAGVEIFRHDHERMFRADRGDVGAPVAGFEHMRRSVIADGLDAEFGDALVGVGAAQLDHRGGRAGVLSIRQLRHDAVLGELDRRYLDIRFVDLAAERRIVDQPLPVVALGRGDDLQPVDRVAQVRAMRRAAALEFEQVFRHRPAIVFRADEIGAGTRTSSKKT